MPRETSPGCQVAPQNHPPVCLEGKALSPQRRFLRGPKDDCPTAVVIRRSPRPLSTEWGACQRREGGARDTTCGHVHAAVEPHARSPAAELRVCELLNTQTCGGCTNTQLFVGIVLLFLSTFDLLHGETRK